MLRGVAIVAGLTLAALGGVIAYRAAFLEPTAAVVVTTESVRELPNVARIVVGVLLLLGGAALAFFFARKK
jgi:hypothetical protein